MDVEERPQGRADARGGARPRPRVRPARAADAAAWRALQRGIYEEGRWFVGDGPPSEATLAARLRGQDTRRGMVWLAELADEIAGWCEATRLGSKRLEHVAVITVGVAARHRRRGCGEALLTEAARWARRVGVRKLSLHVRAGNAAAIALYRRVGFGVEGVERDQVAVDGGYEDEWIMAWHLEAGR
jgi:ribosomal protein S18 acetylase RimI-like enzyme